ncbi:MAG: calcium/sodium antiporter [Clostridiales bacterium]|nr:calcium/sodium antiporter [Clostridiales bacterium]
MTYLLALGGCVLLFAGGEWLVRGAVSLSRRAGISPLLIGMTVVAFCTSAPELVVSLEAAARGQVDLSVGNVVGSNIANILFIIGLSALVTPIVMKPAAIRRDLTVMLGATAVLIGLSLIGVIERWHGGIMVGALITFVWYSYWKELSGDTPAAELYIAEAEEFSGVTKRTWLALLELVVGLAALIAGSQMLVTGAGEIARSFGVAEAIIGLTLVALGTSLPELATSLVAAARGHAEVAVGNVVGSNIFNILGILGVTAMTRSLAVAPGMVSFDVWVMLAAAVALVPLLLWRGRIGRLAGVALIGSYVAYVAVLYTGVAGTGAM